jgi:hypothetical protein
MQKDTLDESIVLAEKLKLLYYWNKIGKYYAFIS